MLRNGAARALARSSWKPTASTSRNSCTLSPLRARTAYSNSAVSHRRPSSLALKSHKPVSASLQRYATGAPTGAPTGPGTPFDHINKKHEEKIAKKGLEPHPDEVSAGSSVRHVMGEEGVEEKERDVDMLAGVKADLVGFLT